MPSDGQNPQPRQPDDVPIERRPLEPHPNDLPKLEAAKALAADVRALNHLHAIEEWTIDVTTGALMGMCSCDHKVHTTAGDHHWAQVVRKVRGLDKLKPPNKK